MLTDCWQDATIEQLMALLSADAEVRGVLLYGSCAREDVRPDCWSDIDLAMVVADGAMAHFFPAADWLAPIGELFACHAHEEAAYNVLHAFFTDGRRIDFKLVNEAMLANANPFYPEGRLLLSRSPALEWALARPSAPPSWAPLSPDAFAQLCNTFRFTAMRAITKAARNELLVALHISLELMRDCLLLGMHLRDRETGINIHRDGSRGNQYVTQLSPLSQPFTQEGILEMIARSAAAFDALAGQWSDDYRECRQPLLKMIEKARAGHHPRENLCRCALQADRLL